MTVSSYNIAPGTTAEEQATKRKIALALMQQGMTTEPIQHWAQGLAKMAQSGIGGYELHQADKEDKAERAKGNELLAQVLGGASPQAAPATAPQAAPSGDFASAISGIESGGKYDALGPVTKTGDRAYGKYQVMGANVPAWTKAHVGQEMTPEQFLADPKIQDAVFKGQFGQYAQKHGPEGAARAWFAGEGGMNDLGRKDQLGTTVGGYGQKFAQALGPQGAPQMPQAAPQGGNNAAIIQMLGNRYTAPIAQQAAGGMIAEQISPKSTDDLREYKFDMQQRQAAGKPVVGFGDWKAELKRAGAIQNQVQIDQRGESEFAKAAGKNQAERFDKIVSGGQDAQQMVASVNTLRELGSRITTGKTAEITAALGPYAEMAGVKIDGLEDMQAYKAIVSKLAPQMRVPGSGATSDFEMRSFLEALPGLGKSPGGNEIISKTLEGIAQHKIAAAEIASKAMAGEIKPAEAEKQLRALPDPLTLWKQQGKTLTAPKAETPPAAPAGGTTKSGIKWSVQ
jgi:hypothetical protein